MRVTSSFLALAACGLLAAPLVSASPQADLAMGIRQVKEGSFAEAVLTLDAVLSRSSAEASDPRDAAQAHLYLGAAYAGLEQLERAKAEFREALRLAPGLRLSADGVPTKAFELFEVVRGEPASASTAAAPLAPPVADAKGAKRSWLKRGLIIAGGAGAAATVGALAAGGNHTPTVTLVSPLQGAAISDVTQVNFSAVGTDPDNDRLSFNWTFGDGGTASGTSVSHVFAGEGTFKVAVTVSDPDGASATATTTAQARTISGVYHPDNDKLLDYELHQMGTTVTGLIDPCCIRFPFEGSLTSPRLISIAYVFIDEGRSCSESINGSFDTALTRITGIYSCTGCRQCKHDATFPVVLTRR